MCTAITKICFLDALMLLATFNDTSVMYFRLTMYMWRHINLHVTEYGFTNNQAHWPLTGRVYDSALPLQQTRGHLFYGPSERSGPSFLQRSSTLWLKDGTQGLQAESDLFLFWVRSLSFLSPTGLPGTLSLLVVCSSVCLSVRSSRFSFPNFSLSSFKILTWNLVYEFVRSLSYSLKPRRERRSFSMCQRTTKNLYLAIPSLGIIEHTIWPMPLWFLENG